MVIGKSSPKTKWIKSMAVIENGLHSYWLFLIVSFNIWNYLNFLFYWGPSWSCSHSSWIYNYLCNQCISLQQLWVWTLFMVRCTRYTIIDKVCQWLVAGPCFSQGTPVFPTNKTGRHDFLDIINQSSTKPVLFICKRKSWNLIEQIQLDINNNEIIQKLTHFRWTYHWKLQGKHWTYIDVKHLDPLHSFLWTFGGAGTIYPFEVS
jgi:hypothetical protein